MTVDLNGKENLSREGERWGIVLAMVIAPLAGYSFINQVPIWLWEMFTPSWAVADLIGAVNALLLGSLWGYLFPRWWRLLVLLSVSGPLGELAWDLVAHDPTMWPFGLLIIILWGGFCCLGAILTRAIVHGVKH